MQEDDRGNVVARYVESYGGMLSSCTGIGNAHVAVNPRIVEFAVRLTQILHEHICVLSNEGLKARVASSVIISPV